MPRRVSLPGASELFRPTERSPAAEEPTDAVDAPSAAAAAEQSGRGSGRIRHDEKITVYVSIDELVALERTRLTLRAEHGMAVDRGRIVREAISAAIADLGERGDGSDLVRRLSQP